MTSPFKNKPFIIAEAGSNWTNLGDILHSIRMAKNVGADAVKFQAYTATALYGPLNYETCITPECHSLSKYQLNLSWLPEMKRVADQVGIELMCTAFSPELVKAVDSFVNIHKIASSDATTPQMLNAVCLTGKPVIISHGAKSYKETLWIKSYMDGRAAYHLQCTAAYPADFSEFDPYQFDGLSDHTLGLTASIVAVKYGARIIEKHFTAIDANTPDKPHSLDVPRFQRMVNLCRSTLGWEAPSPEEHSMMLRHNRRLIALRDLKIGDKLDFGMSFGAYRSLEDDLHGASPIQWEMLAGKTMKCDIARGKGIALNDVE